MQYLLLIYEAESVWKDTPEAQQGKIFQEYMEFTQDIVKSGHFRAGDALQPVATATTVRVRAGRVQTTAGPFAEMGVQFGGYYLVDAANLDEAIAIAARIPGARTGSTEVRPVMVFDRPQA